MASYTDKNKTAVKELIDKYTQDNLDSYIRATIKDAGVAKMDEGASAIEVADAIFDCISKSFTGDVNMAASCKQICPKNILLVLRNEIIKTLK